MLSANALVAIAHSYYPRSVSSNDAQYTKTPEYHRLMVARRRAAEQRAPWRVMLDRIRAQLPSHEVHDQVLSCPAEALDACYSCRISHPASPGEGYHGVMLSFLVPFYAIYSARYVPDPAPGPSPEPPATVDVYVGDTMYVVPATALTPEQLQGLREGEEAVERRRRESIQRENPVIAEMLAGLRNAPRTRREVSFAPPSDGPPWIEWLGREIEATFGHRYMTPSIGSLIVPGVETNLRPCGEATLYDCLFSDNR